MQIPNPYFNDVPRYGNLIMEQIIVDYVYPLLSVLKDVNGKRYLCVCFDTRGTQQWIVSPIISSVLIRLLRNKITLEAAFRKTDDAIVYVSRDYDLKMDSYKMMQPDEVPEEYLPAKGEYLDAEIDEWEDYIIEIKTSESLWETDLSEKVFYCSNICSIKIPFLVRREKLFQETNVVEHYRGTSQMRSKCSSAAY